MKIKSLKIPVIIIAIGLIVAVAAHLLTSMQMKPTVTEQDFPYSVTYKIDGETKTFDGVYACRFEGFGADGVDPLDRYYTEEYIVDGADISTLGYIIAEKDGEIAFVEVKTRSTDSYGMPREAVRTDKKRRYYQIATFYGLQTGEEPNARFDVIEVYCDGYVYRINHLPNAF